MTQLIPGETSEDSPFKTLGIEIAKSITSTPLLMLPNASSIVFPLSSTIIFARLSISSSIIDLNRDIICARSRMLVFDQLKKALLAALTASSR